MPTLFQAEGAGWRLEVVGRIPELPPFLTVMPSTSITSTGVRQMSRIDVASGRLLPIVSEEKIEPLFYEAVGYDIHFEREDATTSISLPFGADPRRIKPEVEHHFLSFGNNVGFVELFINSAIEKSSIRFEVFPRKLDYRFDYLAMREEVSAILRNLAMSANSKTFGLAMPDRCTNPTLLEWFSLVCSYFGDFIKLSQSIAKNPHSTLVKVNRTVDVERARRVSRHTVERSMRRKNAGPKHFASGAVLPRRIQETVSRTTFDTPENQYFKALILETYRKIRVLARTDVSGDEDADIPSEKCFFNSIRPALENMQRQIEALLSLPFMMQVSGCELVKPNSMVFYTH